MFINSIHQAGYEAMKRESFQEALELLNEALQLSPGHPDILGDRGVLYIHLKMEDKAMEDFNLAIEMQPEYGYRFAARAYAKDFFGDTHGAIADYERAVELDPKDAVAYNNLGLLQEKLGYQEKAKTQFERADKLAKTEKHLMQILDNLEKEQSEEDIEPDAQSMEKSTKTHETINPVVMREVQRNAWTEFKSIFTSKEQFNQFVNFIKNGFKIK